MYLRRRIDEYLASWKKGKHRLPLLVRGIKECGKTRSVKEFAKKHYNHVFYIDFVKNPEAKKDFLNEDITMMIEKLITRFPKEKIVEGETIFIFDNIAYFREGIDVMKRIQHSKHYDVIGISERIDLCDFNDEEVLLYDMKTMDFIEFLNASSFNKKQLEIVYDAFTNKKNIPFTLHKAILKAFYEYVLVGGFPSSVESYLEFHKLEDAYRENQKIYFEIENDFGKRLDEDNKQSFLPIEVDIIHQIIDLIPEFLMKDNKRFYLHKISSGSNEEKMSAIKYLEDLGMISLNYNVLSLPLQARNKVDDRFKIFYNDLSFITSTFKPKKRLAITKGNLSLDKGDLLESIVSDALYKLDIPTYHQYNDDGEVDFVIKGEETTIIIESKGRTLKYHKTLLENHRIIELYKIDDTNIIVNNKITNIPIYLLYFLKDKMI